MQDFYPLDKYLLPGTLQDTGEVDGGDTAAIWGNLVALQPNPSAMLSVQQYLMRDGKPLRHPDVSRWPGQPDRFSRDQFVPCLCARLMVRSATVVDEMLSAHGRRLFLTAWNTRANGKLDAPLKFPYITGPQVWALELRIWAEASFMKRVFVQPLLHLLDLESFVGTFITNQQKSRITRNHMLIAITCRVNQPTLTSWLTFKLTNFKKLLPAWGDHCRDTKEYQTEYLFRDFLKQRFNINA